jgi:hypothetical protein
VLEVLASIIRQEKELEKGHVKLSLSIDEMTARVEISNTPHTQKKKTLWN